MDGFRSCRRDLAQRVLRPRRPAGLAVVERAATVTEQRRGYAAYLLRLWRVKDKGKTHWRASLENAHTGERKGFAGLDALFAFLRQQTDDEASAVE